MTKCIYQQLERKGKLSCVLYYYTHIKFSVNTNKPERAVQKNSLSHCFYLVLLMRIIFNFKEQREISLLQSQRKDLLLQFIILISKYQCTKQNLGIITILSIALGNGVYSFNCDHTKNEAQVCYFIKYYLPLASHIS